MNVKDPKLISNYEYFNPMSFVNMLIYKNYVIMMREDNSEFIRDYFSSRYQIPFYVSSPSHLGLSGFPVSKRLEKNIKLKIDKL